MDYIDNINIAVMKKIGYMLAALAMAALGGVPAEGQTLDLIRIGEVPGEYGTMVRMIPSTTVVIDITVTREVVKTGPYARYAQKYFGVIAPLADKETYTLRSARVSYYDPAHPADMSPGELPEPKTVMVVDGEGADFPKVLPDRMSAANPSVEEAARTIFDLRKRKTEMITGQYAETIFGAGLEPALRRMDRMEKEYMELFFGKQTETTYTVRYCITPVAGETTAVVCRFREDTGLLPSDDLSGEPVVLECRPQGVAAALYPASRRGNPKSGEAEFAVPDMVECRVVLGRDELGSATIPVLQYGVRTVLAVKSAW